MSTSCPPRFRALLATAILARTVSLISVSGAQAGPRAVVDIDQVTVGSPGNPSTAVVPFTDAVYPSCSDAPSGSTNCLEIGDVSYRFQIGEIEVKLTQWVKFLNTVDPGGRNRFGLFSQFQKPSAWPQYGQVRRVVKAKEGQHYLLASDAWANKPYAFGNFLSAARFANSLSNGTLLDKSVVSEDGFDVTTYRVRLSPETSRGMYDLGNRRTERNRKRGFVVPSQDEWVKAAYFDPATEAYWKYPTNAGVYGDGSATAPTPTALDYSTGDVVNQATQPLATFRQSGLPAPEWCPSYAQVSGGCSTQNPFGLGPEAYEEVYVAGLSSVGQALSRSPWGTLDQGGNVVEWTDTVTPPPAGITGKRVWRRLHGGVSNAPAYQMWPSAVGLQPHDNIFYDHVYPWLGFRIGVIGNLSVEGREAQSDR